MLLRVLYNNRKIKNIKSIKNIDIITKFVAYKNQ